ncbi:MAG TPA: PQQ-binding-like beta-propeller repeat protein [Blastocatellia bacterium]
MKALRAIAILCLALAPVTTGRTSDPDWPQWKGPDRTGVSKETGFLKSWPAAGPQLAWSVSNLGEGYGTVAIQSDRIFVQGAREGSSVVFSLNRADGKTVWTTPLGPRVGDDRGPGPRGTPTVEGDRVYALSENGDLACLRFRDGTVVWQRNILKDFGGRNIGWLISESPLIDGDKLIVTPGGNEAGIVALDKMTGKTVWTCKELNEDAGYASCLAVDVGGVRTIIGFTSRAGVGVRSSDGKLMWRYTQAANRTANCTTPIFYDNKVFYTSAYDTGCALLALKAQGGEVKAEEVYFNRDMMNHHGGVVLVNGYLYGFSNSILTCMEFATGKVMWRDRSVGKGSLTYADGMLYLLSENQVVGLAEASPQGYAEKGRFRISDQGWPSWAHPVVCGGKLYIRNQGVLACYNVKS